MSTLTIECHRERVRRIGRANPPPPHPITPSEANAALTRAGMYGDELDDGIVIDPATGGVVPPELNHPA